MYSGSPKGAIYYTLELKVQIANKSNTICYLITRILQESYYTAFQSCNMRILSDYHKNFMYAISPYLHLTYESFVLLWLKIDRCIVWHHIMPSREWWVKVRGSSNMELRYVWSQNQVLWFIIVHTLNYQRDFCSSCLGYLAWSDPTQNGLATWNK